MQLQHHSTPAPPHFYVFFVSIRTLNSKFAQWLSIILFLIRKTMTIHCRWFVRQCHLILKMRVTFGWCWNRTPDSNSISPAQPGPNIIEYIFSLNLLYARIWAFFESCDHFDLKRSAFKGFLKDWDQDCLFIYSMLTWNALLKMTNDWSGFKITHAG